LIFTHHTSSPPPRARVNLAAFLVGVPLFSFFGGNKLVLLHHFEDRIHGKRKLLGCPRSWKTVGSAARRGCSPCEGQQIGMVD
ncbi:hypothetical protein L6654_42815, partial [Bradyrhizobium sp. WYCCWR 13023]